MVTARASVIALVGDGQRLKEEKVRAVVSSLGTAGSRDLDLKTYYGEEACVSEILACAATIPFLSSQRTIIIRHFDRLPKDEKEALVKSLARPLPHTTIILDIQDASWGKVFSSLGAHARVIPCGTKDEPDPGSYIRRAAGSRSVRFEPEAFESFRESQDASLSGLDQELEKLLTYIEGRPVVTMQDVRAVVTPSATTSAFDLGTMISDKKISGALELVSDLLLNGKKSHEIIGLLSWHFKRLTRAKLLNARGQGETAIAVLLKVPGRYARGFFQQARSTGITQLRACIEILFETDRDIKRSKGDPKLLLELAIVRLCLT